PYTTLFRSPSFIAHLTTVDVVPRGALDAGNQFDRVVAEPATTQRWMCATQCPHTGDPVDQRLTMLFRRLFPVKPRDLIVLTVRVVIAFLAVRELVSGQQHRRTVRYQHCCQH